MDSNQPHNPVTDRARSAANPEPQSEAVRGLWALVAEGKATWGGGKPVGARIPYRGPSVAAAVVEDRG